MYVYYVICVITCQYVGLVCGQYAVSMRSDTVLMRLLFASKMHENILFEAMPNLIIKLIKPINIYIRDASFILFLCFSLFSDYSFYT